MALDCPFAHSPNGLNIRHGLVEHLEGTARRASEFGASFGRAEECRLAGLWHDIGKADPEFQGYLDACASGPPPTGKVDHKTAGALFAARSGMAHLGIIILGHHGGMCNRGDALNTLKGAAENPTPGVNHALSWAAARLTTAPTAAPPREENAAERDVLYRLMFSAVVDADFLDTEAHFDAERSAGRQPSEAISSMAELRAMEQTAHERFLMDRQTSSRIDGIRAEIRSAALTAAAAEPGLFRLTVPTGGGKTRAALAFALAHAAIHDLNRVVAALPFVTITDQTAEVYREVLAAAGRTAVLEHHSGIDLEAETNRDPAVRVWRRLAAENWDAPVVVTTTVRLFESLFSNRPSALRKAHRLARSVVILDEAQAIRLAVLGVTTDLLGALSRRAKCTIVLCTATQPALEAVTEGLGHIHEIVPQHQEHFESLRRVTFDVRAIHEKWSWPTVAAHMRTERQSMTIVNRRRDALALLDELGPEALHLSTLLCGAHRRKVLTDVRNRLASDGACQLVATQVVEAGVDLDFPLVLRALAPFDSIVQAAGRCNREGRVPPGRCIVFEPEANDCFGDYAVGRDELRGMLQAGAVDFGSPTQCRDYFELRYGSGSLLPQRIDPDGLRKKVEELRFQSVSDAYRLIPDATLPLVVLYPDEATKIQALINEVVAALQPGEARRILRKLEPYTVSVYENQLATARRRGWVEARGPLTVWTAAYDARCGIAALLAEPGQEGVGSIAST